MRSHFSKLHPRAIDEPWYKRAVDQHRIDASSFVFSLPHGIPNNSTLVTASHAIFHTNQMNQSAPVAVVGFQLQHSALDALFRNITRDCAKVTNYNTTNYQATFQREREREIPRMYLQICIFFQFPKIFD